MLGLGNNITPIFCISTPQPIKSVNHIPTQVANYLTYTPQHISGDQWKELPNYFDDNNYLNTAFNPSTSLKIVDAIKAIAKADINSQVKETTLNTLNSNLQTALDLQEKSATGLTSISYRNRTLKTPNSLYSLVNPANYMSHSQNFNISPVSGSASINIFPDGIINISGNLDFGSNNNLLPESNFSELKNYACLNNTISQINWSASYNNHPEQKQECTTLLVTQEPIMIRLV